MRWVIYVVAVCLLTAVGCQDYVGFIETSNDRNQNPEPVCGNGRVESGEECDHGTDNSDTDPDGCRMDCRMAHCGDDVIDSGEVCDRKNLAGMNCEDLGYTKGALHCATDCTSLDTYNCSLCGNGIAEGVYSGDDGYETCDGSDLRGQDCFSVGQAAGTLACTEVCTWDFNGCTGAVCGNGVVEKGEQCDDVNVAGGDGCGPTCLFEECGNGAVDSSIGEECDDGNLKSHDGCSSGCTVEAPRWVETTPAHSPPAQFCHSMAYDTARRRVVLLGLWYGDEVSSTTWEYDGADWLDTTPAASPPVRWAHAMSYDMTRAHVVLFGGETFEGMNNWVLGDTWEYDGNSWHETTPSTSPRPRRFHSIAYDQAHGRVMLFSGCRTAVGCSSSRSDTWEYDGSGWEETTPEESPNARFGHAITYDSLRGRSVLFGGFEDTGWPEYEQNRLADTWEYDGTGWSETTPVSSPPARSRHSMALDEARGRTVMFGGGSDSEMSDTWEYDGIKWLETTPSDSPPARSSHAMVYDKARRCVVLFGGWNAGTWFGDTWEYKWDSEWPDELCDNAADDDLDGLTDYADPDCDALLGREL